MPALTCYADAFFWQHDPRKMRENRQNRHRPGGLQQVQTQTGAADTVSASGTSSAARSGFVAEELSLNQSPDAPNSWERGGSSASRPVNGHPRHDAAGGKPRYTPGFPLNRPYCLL